MAKIIQYIKNKNHQKATSEKMFSLLKKEDHCKDLSVPEGRNLEEEIGTRISSGKLQKNDNNPLFIDKHTE